MWRIVLWLSVFGWAQAHFGHHNPLRPLPRARNYRLCTYSQPAYDKCLYTVEAAKNSSLELPLECQLMDGVDACVLAVRNRASDLVVLSEHGYRAARQQWLEPILYARESGNSLYVAVAPRNITLVDVTNSALDVDKDNDRALHAAAFFNLMRGHNICSMTSNVGGDGDAVIKIVDYAQYSPTAAEILICPDRRYAEFMDFRSCNIEASLQRAVFVAHQNARNHVGRREVQRIFDTVLQNFGPPSDDDESESEQQFNFFSTFDGVDDVIFANDTVAFDPQPLIRNGRNEQVFNLLHCNKSSQDHDHIIKG